MLDLETEFSQTEEHNGITFTRLPNMPNIARVETLNDLALWKDREELGLNGLITTYPDDDQAARAARDMSEYAHSNPDIFTPLVDNNMVSESAVNMTSVIYQEAWATHDPQSVRPQMHQNLNMLPDSVQEVISTLSNTFVNTTEANSMHGNNIPLYMRVNSDYPIEPHNHGEENAKKGDTMTVALSGYGSVLHDDAFENSYRMQAGEVALFDETVWHGADEYDESWQTDPRTNIILG